LRTPFTHASPGARLSCDARGVIARKLLFVYLCGEWTRQCTDLPLCRQPGNDGNAACNLAATGVGRRGGDSPFVSRSEDSRERGRARRPLPSGASYQASVDEGATHHHGEKLPVRNRVRGYGQRRDGRQQPATAWLQRRDVGGRAGERGHFGWR